MYHKNHMSEAFIETATRFGFSDELTRNIINQFGDFKALNYWSSTIESDAFSEREVSGWSAISAECFYKHNEVAIKEWVTKATKLGRFDYLLRKVFDESEAKFLSKLKSVENEGFSIDEIEAFLTENQDLERYNDFTKALSWAVVTALCERYSNWYTCIMGG